MRFLVADKIKTLSVMKFAKLCKEGMFIIRSIYSLKIFCYLAAYSIAFKSEGVCIMYNMRNLTPGRITGRQLVPLWFQWSIGELNF